MYKNFSKILVISGFLYVCLVFLHSSGDFENFIVFHGICFCWKGFMNQQISQEHKTNNNNCNILNTQFGCLYDSKIYF